MDIISEFNEKLNYLNERALDFTQLMRILREEYNLNKKCLLYEDFENYFNTIFSYLYNHAIIEAYKFFDNGSDCISIDKIKEFAHIHFDTIFPLQHDASQWSFEHSLSSREELFSAIKTIRNQIKDTIIKIKDIRNKSGLAHGQPIDYTKTIPFKELELVETCLQDIINIFNERFKNTRFAFTEYIIHYNSLKDLQSIYEAKVGAKCN